ncbi:MAG: translation initiation factor IF-2 [Pseudobdellovibrionaceae bacterium]
MDKIKEWQLPVRSHMVELEPEVLEQIKIRLNGGGDRADEPSKTKKAVPRKTVKKSTATAPDNSSVMTMAKAAAAKSALVKKTAAATVEVVAPVATTTAPSAGAKASVIRRKTKEAEEVEALQVKAIDENSSPQESSSEETLLEKKPVIKEASLEVLKELKPAPAAVATSSQAAVRVISSAATPSVDSTTKSSATAEVSASSVVASVGTATSAAPAVANPAASAAVVTPAGATPGVSPVATAPSALVARKKEVVVGTSGIASSATPMSSGPKRNIIGRMDLSRVTPPPGRPQPSGDRGMSGPGGRPGFGGPPRPGGAPMGARNIRTGFVAAAAPPALDAFPDDSFDRRDKDLDKKNKKLSAGTVAPATREKEEVVEAFNAVEFRKRELVFQPKKKKGFLERAALKTAITTPKASKRVVKVNGTMKLSDLASEMGLKVPQLTKVLMANGVTAAMNSDLDFDTIALIAPEFNWEAQNTFQTADQLAEETAFGDLTAESIIRPPVVTVMGHVDHGKTSLLDAIRNARVASGEAGGITQHIGAYSVQLEDGHLVTFLDTPGHEAFTAMRARGANATDIAVIVVAADDGMMPQTQEAINHAKAAGVPIIVAVNKIDKPGANVDKIKQQLTELEIVPEEWGGTTIFCEVSALKKLGIKELLEQIHVVAEMQELKANPKRSGTGIVIEAKVEKGKGSVATLLVRDGTISVGQHIVAGTVQGRIRSLTNDRGERVQSVGPGLPVEVLGLDSTPAAGDKFDIVIDEDTAGRVSQLRKTHADKAAHVPTSKMSLEDIFAKVKSGDVKELSLVLKADVHGSLEALQGMLAKISTAEVKAKVIHAVVGGINESDVLLAHTAKGIVLGFNVRPDAGAQAKAKQLGVDVRTYSIVYELIDEMKKAMGGLLTPDVVEKILGRAEVRNTFTVPKAGTIAGCFVVDCKIQRSNMLRLIRDGKIVYEGKISSLKRFKDDAKEVASGFECGLAIENFNDIKNGDILEAFVKEEVARELGSPLAQA